MTAVRATHLRLVTAPPRERANGDQHLEQRLQALADSGVRLLQARRTPGEGIIDHLALAPSGLWVIDVKHYRGRPQPGRGDSLLVGRRDGRPLVHGLHQRVRAVRNVVHPSIPVHGILCFAEADWPLIGGSFDVGGLHVAWPKKACDLIRSGRNLDDAQLASLEQRLADAFPPVAQLRTTHWEQLRSVVAY